jgi:tripartite-type tricarboxylate transporter receptor subunit TctC
MTKFLTMGLIGAAFAVATAAQAADAIPGADYYKGKTVTYIVATAPGGGYDTYGRLVARYMEKALPGSTFVVKNMPGAGHIIGANQVYASKPDGLTIGIFNTGLIYAQLAGSEGIKFDLRKFTYIGKASTDPRTVMVSAKSDLKSVDDLKKPGPRLKFAASGVGSAAYNEEKMLIDSLGWNVDIIAGYNGKEDELAIMRGEVVGSVGSLSTYEGFVRDGNGRFLMQIGGKPPAGVPSSDVIKGGQGEAVINLIKSQGEIGRLTAAPPGLPAERKATLIAAYKAALENKDLQAEAAKLDRPVEPLYGDDVTKLVNQAMTQDAPTVAMLKSLLNATPAPAGGKVSTALVEVIGDGKEVTFKDAQGKVVKSVLSGSRTKLTIGGKEGDRKALKAGMMCDIEYKPGGDNEPSILACK